MFATANFAAIIHTVSANKFLSTLQMSRDDSRGGCNVVRAAFLILTLFCGKLERASFNRVLRSATMPNSPQPPSLPQDSHLPPSLPSSPLPKRSKIMAQSPPSSPNKPPPLSQSPPLLIQKLSSAAKTPTRGSKFAAGYDLYSARATTIPARGKSLVDTDLAIAVPEGTCQF